MNDDQRIIIQQALAGEHAAFELIIREYSRTLYAIAFGILRNEENAEDVVQESFLKAWKSRWRIRNPEKFPQWLYAIVRNQSKDFLRKRQSVQVAEEVPEVADENILHPARAMDADEVSKKVDQVLSTLPEHHRMALTLRYLEGMDHRTIEEVMGLSNGAVRGLLGRGLETMRKALNPSLLAKI